MHFSALFADCCIQINSHKVQNIFDSLPALATPQLEELQNELTRYLNIDPEQVQDVLLWWTKRKATYPHLSRMALDYLTIPGEFLFSNLIEMLSPPTATSTDVKQVFSQDRVLLSHVRNHLSSQSIRALICLGSWSLLGLVKDNDIFAVTSAAEVEGEEEELEDGWDLISGT